MPKFDAAQALDVLAIYQLLGEWANEIDQRNGVGMGPMLTQDCCYNVPANSYQGRSEVVKYYEARLAELEKGAAGVPAHRHVLSNLCVDLTGPDTAKVSFVMVYFTGLSADAGCSPADPALVGDGGMIVRREADGEWRIARLDTQVVLPRATATVR